MLLYKRAGSGATRFVALDSDGINVWVGGNDQASTLHEHELLDSETFATLDTMETTPAGGHGGFVTTARIYWSSDHFTPDFVTFPIVRRKDEALHGEYRTKRLILERYDALAEAARSTGAVLRA